MASRHLSEEDLTDYLDGGLEQAELPAAEEHLRQCPACAAALARVRSASETLSALRMVPAPDGLRRDVVARLAARHAAALTCRKAVPLLQDCADGLLAPAAALSLRHHLDACSPCRAALAAWASLLRVVRALPMVQSPPRVRETVHTARQTQSKRSSWTPSGVRWRPAVALAGALAVGGLILIARVVPQHPGPARLVASARERQIALARPSEGRAPIEAAASPRLSGEPQPRDGATTSVEEARVASSPAPQAVRVARVPVRAVSDQPRDPAPLRTAAGHSPAKEPVPSALQTLRVVARSASHGGELQRAMELAGERFSTLSSEAMLARLPQAGTLERGGEGMAAGDAAAAGEPGAPSPAEEHPSEATRGPAWQGAISAPGPFA